MAFVERDGARIWWTSLGEGEPIVLIMGLGCSSAMWFRLAPKLALHYRVLLLDNRGVGQTQVRHSVVHSVSSMAADVAAVLDDAGEANAHVLGFSMGGMIAQQFACNYPARVCSLILAATNCGSMYSTLAESHVLDLLFQKGEMSPGQSLQAMRPYTYAANTPAAKIGEDTLIRLTSFPTLRGYQAQLYGLIGWNSYFHLPKLNCPTLILHGREDRLIPPANGRLLAQRIAGAELLEWDDASHWIHTDQTERTAAAVEDFVRAHRSDS